MNSFPTAAGLASSASGYAALATALAAFAPRRIPVAELSRLARSGSGSAARSIPGGLAYLPAGDDPAARCLQPADRTPWAMAVAVVDAPPKQTSSRAGMEHCRLTSPYFPAWVRSAKQDCRELLCCVADWDLPHAGEIAERNMLMMHACMHAARPPLVYWNPATLALVQAVAEWRRRGLLAFATVDAGPHVVVLCERRDLTKVAQRIRSSGLAQLVIPSLPGGPARVTAQE